MINTDASGQGSGTYGKTHDHVLEIPTVLLGGELLHSSPSEKGSLEQETARRDRIGKVYRCAVGIADNQAYLIAQIFPNLTAASPAMTSPTCAKPMGASTSTACCAAPRARWVLSSRPSSTCCPSRSIRFWSTCATPASWTRCAMPRR